jgi:hypothetical protein
MAALVIGPKFPDSIIRVSSITRFRGDRAAEWGVDDRAV